MPGQRVSRHIESRLDGLDSNILRRLCTLATLEKTGDSGGKVAPGVKVFYNSGKSDRSNRRVRDLNVLVACRISVRYNSLKGRLTESLG